MDPAECVLYAGKFGFNSIWVAGSHELDLLVEPMVAAVMRKDVKLGNAGLL